MNVLLRSIGWAIGWAIMVSLIVGVSLEIASWGLDQPAPSALDAFGADTLSVDEESAYREICLQWYVPDADNARAWEWRCMDLDDLRLEWFPESE